MSRLHGGPLDGATIACDDTDLKFDHVVHEIVSVPPSIAKEGQARMATIYRYRRTEPGADFQYIDG